MSVVNKCIYPIKAWNLEQIKIWVIVWLRANEERQMCSQAHPDLGFWSKGIWTSAPHSLPVYMLHRTYDN